MTDRWIGLVEVKATHERSVLAPDGVAAYATVVALANDVQDFERRVSLSLDRMGLTIVACVDVELFDERAAGCILDPEIRELADALSAADPVLFDAFCVFPADEIGDE